MTTVLPMRQSMGAAMMHRDLISLLLSGTHAGTEFVCLAKSNLTVAWVNQQLAQSPMHKGHSSCASRQLPQVSM